MGITSVGVITIICYLVAQVLKMTKLNTSYLPIICGVLGAILGVVSLFVMDGFPAEDMLTAIGVGIVSGLAATGANQVYKQMSAPTTMSTGKK